MLNNYVIEYVNNTCCFVAHGFTKLVKRDDGVYENVTARNGDSRYMERGKPETVPDLSKTITD